MKKRNMLTKISLSVMFILSIVVTISILLLNNDVNGSMVKPQKEYITITVEYKDTLWDIATNHMNPDYYNYDTFIEEVTSINGISESRIYAGNHIVIPIVKTSDSN